MKKLLTIAAALSLVVIGVLAQGTSVVTGHIKDQNDVPVSGVVVALKDTRYHTVTDKEGKYVLDNIPAGNYTIVVFSYGSQTIQQSMSLAATVVQRNFTLSERQDILQEVNVEASLEQTLGLSRLKAVDNFGVYEGKKTEVVVLRDLTVNTATNNPRQLYSKVTGLNIWESDGVGLQLGIGGRGLSPNRTANFNTRQNGYDISADALGYPESYYTPPAEALEQIEIVRGAASLQYGTQFGGLLNFQFKKGPSDKKFEVTSRQSIGSWNFFGSFNSIGGTTAEGKLNYYAYYNYKRGDGYRPNAGFDYHNAYASVRYQVSPQLLVNVDLTKMNYLAQQPGGLTDRLFEQDARQSVRSRNWFKVDWNMMAVNVTYKFSHLTQLNIRNFGLLASRESLGNLERINVADFGENRTLIRGEFRNVGNETRLLHRYNVLGKQHALVTGVRLYRGTSYARQGDGTNRSGPDFYFLNPESLENSDYVFPNENYSFFVENIFDITRKLSVTPGIRYERIKTRSVGYYKNRVYDGAGNIVAEETKYEADTRNRNFLIAGLGVSFKTTEKIELYGNVSQNYRAINFTDLRIVNPNFVVDPNIQDEKGYTADIGVRGVLRNFFRFEATAFQIMYKGKIGQVLKTDPVLYNDYRFRGNISDARNRGIEAFGELNISQLLKLEGESAWSAFFNTSFIQARYINTEDASIRHKKVEMVPPFMLRTGASYKFRKFSTSIQFLHTAEHFSDATNARRTATAVEGIIPSYQVVDLSAGYEWKMLRLEASCNNLLNEKYFTRRAESYPGPGIIPSDGRGFYLTLQAKVGR
jgi:Fe(3+) dicitrate transport protein